MISPDERFAVYDLLAEYAACLDDCRLNDWLDLFVEDCLYRIVPRENYAANLPLSLVLCDSKDMLRDRVARRLLEENADEDRDRMVADCIAAIRARRARTQRGHLLEELRAAQARGDLVAERQLTKHLTEKTRT